MKYCTCLSFIAALSVSATSFAQQYQFIAMDNSRETQLCVNVGNNNVPDVKKVLRSLGYNQRLNINTIACNDLSLARFAFKYDASDTFKYVNRYSYGHNRVKTIVTI